MAIASPSSPAHPHGVLELTGGCTRPVSLSLSGKSNASFFFIASKSPRHADPIAYLCLGPNGLAPLNVLVAPRVLSKQLPPEPDTTEERRRRLDWWIGVVGKNVESAGTPAAGMWAALPPTLPPPPPLNKKLSLVMLLSPTGWGDVSGVPPSCWWWVES